MRHEEALYNTKVVKYFVLAAMFWGVAGMLVGVLIAAQLYWPALNFNSEYLNFGKLRPLHTNGVIYGFGTCMLMGTSLYIVQRTGKVALLSDEDSDVCERYGVWVEKKMYGRTFMGIERSTVLIDGAGVIARIWRKVKVDGHAEEVLAAARSLSAT